MEFIFRHGTELKGLRAWAIKAYLPGRAAEAELIELASSMYAHNLEHVHSGETGGYSAKIGVGSDEIGSDEIGSDPFFRSDRAGS
jgi:hypothetical protein